MSIYALEVEKFSDTSNVELSSDSNTLEFTESTFLEASSKTGNPSDDKKSKVKDGNKKLNKYLIDEKAKILSKKGPEPKSKYDDKLPIFINFIDESGELIIGLDYNSAKGKKTDYESKIRKIIGTDIPFKIITGFVMENSCGSVYDMCRPMWGGIEMSGSKVGAITLPYLDNNGKIGVIISGHTVGIGTGQNVFQAAVFGSNPDYIGSVITNESGPRNSDAAFVETNPEDTVELKIFKDSFQSYNVIGTKGSDQTNLGALIHKMGPASGETSGGLQSTGVTISGGTYNILNEQAIASYPSFQNDSGAPVYQKDLGDDVYFIGIHVGHACFSDYPPTDQIIGYENEDACDGVQGILYTYYSTWEHIKSELNLVDFDEICNPPSTGSWIVNQDCTMIGDAIIEENVIVNSPSVVTIPSGITLDIDFENQNLTVKSGAGVLIKQGGTIT